MSNFRYSFPAEMTPRFNFNPLYISTSKYEGEWQYTLHTHHFSEIFYITSGKGEFQINDVRLSVKENDFLIINPHISHTEYSDEVFPLEFIAIGIEDISFEFDPKLKEQNYALYNYGEPKENLNHILKLLKSETTQQKLYFELVCKNLIEMFLIYLVRKQHLTINPSFDTKMSKECGIAKRYIDSNYMKNITLDLLAEITHMNKFYLVHSFTKYTGLSPINYLTHKRIQIAQDLLSSTDFSISQIASHVGFSSQSYFSQVFRKTLNMTPVHYRKKYLKNLTVLNTSKS